MAFKDDFNATLKIWKEGSLIWKIISGLGMVVGAISLLSISDTIFAFKGVIVRLVDFYRTLLSPVTEYLGRVYELGKYDADVLVLASIFWIAFGRGLINAGEDWISDAVSSFVTSAVSIAASVLILMYAHWLVLLAIVGAVLSGLVLTVIDADEPEEERREDLLIIEAFVIQFLIAFVAIAVSEGIMRPLV